MGTRRRGAGALAFTAVALAIFAVPAPAGAGSLDVCAQRVIRDWYSGGRVDRVYPLRCYRAAIRALPSDVLQYSDADQDIRRALAFARRGRSDPGDGPGAAAPAENPEPAAKAPAKRAAPPARTSPPATKPAADDVAIPPRQARLVPDPPTAAASVPYPVIALAGLAGVLLATGAAGWLASRRHGPGSTPDR
jgi:hypothetical protein